MSCFRTFSALLRPGVEGVRHQVRDKTIVMCHFFQGLFGMFDADGVRFFAHAQKRNVFSPLAIAQAPFFRVRPLTPRTPTGPSPGTVGPSPEE